MTTEPAETYPKDTYLPVAVQVYEVEIENTEIAGALRPSTHGRVDWDGTPWEQRSDSVWNEDSGEWESSSAEGPNADLVDTAETEVHRAFTALEGLRAIFYEMNLGDKTTAGDYSAADQCEALYVLMGRLGMEVA